MPVTSRSIYSSFDSVALASAASRHLVHSLFCCLPLRRTARPELGIDPKFPKVCASEVMFVGFSRCAPFRDRSPAFLFRFVAAPLRAPQARCEFFRRR